MRPADFTVEQIIEAGQALQGAGRSITGFALRQKVGGGNPTRLKQVWDEYQSSQSVAEIEPVAELPIEVAQQLAQVSEALVSRLNSMAVEINDRAVKASERRVAEVVRAAGEQREQAERELADASQTVDDLEQQLDSALEAGEVVKQQLAQAQASKQAQDVELAQVRERLAAVEKAAKGAADAATARDKQLQTQVNELKQQLIQAQEAKQAQDVELAQVRERLSATSDREKDLQQQLEVQRRSEQMSREREAQAVGAVNEMEKRHLEDAEVCQTLRVELRAASDLLSQAQAEGKSQAAQLDQVKADLKDVREELKTAVKAASEATGREQAALAQLNAVTGSENKPSGKAPAKTPE